MANQIQVRLKTTNDEFSVPDSTTSVPASVGSDQLNKLVHSLLTNNLDKRAFDTLGKRIDKRELPQSRISPVLVHVHCCCRGLTAWRMSRRTALHHFLL